MPATKRLLLQHPIGVVARRTGLKPDLIRAWERRYSVVSPSRSTTRRRLYSDEDVERLQLLAIAVRCGRNISQLAALSNSDLESLIAAESLTAARAPQPPPPSATNRTNRRGDAANSAIDACMQAIFQLDSLGLAQQLDRASVQLSRQHLLEHVLVPLLYRVGDQWHNGSLRPVHEHVASMVVRTFLGQLLNHPAVTATSAPLLVTTTPAGQRHELGAMIVAAAAAAEGWRVAYLGPDLPAEEIAAAAYHRDARAVGLSITFPPDDPALGPELERLGRLLPAPTALLVGGQSAMSYRGAYAACGARAVPDLNTLRSELGRLRHSAGDPNLDKT